MRKIKTRNGFIYNANDLVHSQLGEQIKLAALPAKRRALFRPTGAYRQGSPVGLALGMASDKLCYSKGLIHRLEVE